MQDLNTRQGDTVLVNQEWDVELDGEIQRCRIWDVNALERYVSVHLFEDCAFKYVHVDKLRLPSDFRTVNKQICRQICQNLL